jgi:hypothetical protein
MYSAYLITTVVYALLIAFSGIGKVRRDPRQVRVIHETIGIPLKHFPLLAACEFAGAAGLVAGIWWTPIGMAAGVGLVLYFVGAILSHVRAGDAKGVGPAAFLLVLAAAVLTLRIVAI